jgi:hypothetical protein
VDEQSHGRQVVITDVRMPFVSMVIFMIKWSIAAIPALIILAFIAAIFWSILAVFLMGV